MQNFPFKRTENTDEWRSFTSQFAIKGRQGDGKCLKSTQGKAVVHGKHILSYPPKLHHNVVHWREIFTDIRNRNSNIFIYIIWYSNYKYKDTNNSPLSGWTIWKFFTDAWVTRPWKFSTYDWVCSFQLGDLFTRVTRFSLFPFSYRVSRDSSSWNMQNRFHFHYM